MPLAFGSFGHIFSNLFLTVAVVDACVGAGGAVVGGAVVGAGGAGVGAGGAGVGGAVVESLHAFCVESQYKLTEFRTQSPQRSVSVLLNSFSEIGSGVVVSHVEAFVHAPNK